VTLTVISYTAFPYLPELYGAAYISGSVVAYLISKGYGVCYSPLLQPSRTIYYSFAVCQANKG